MKARSQDQLKEAVGEAAADLVEDEMTLGYGTGSTAAAAMRALARRVASEGLSVRGVPTSFAAERLARELNLPLCTLDDVDSLDLALDGADEVFHAPDNKIHVIKGRGGAHSREKVVANAARRFVVLVDESKVVDRLGIKMPVPVEVLPMALRPVERALRGLSGAPELRMGVRKDGPVVTDQGFWILDVRFSAIPHPEALDRAILSIPGVLDHGLFVARATDVLVAAADGVAHLTGRGA